MGTQLQLILIAYIVNLVLTFVQLHNPLLYQEIPSHMYDESEFRENFQKKLFDSIATNDEHKSERYREILRKKVAGTQQAFDTMKEELRRTQNRNFYKKRNYYGKMNNDGNTIKLSKRETNENRNNKGEITRKCNQNATALRIEIANARQEISDLRQNYSFIQEELKHVQDGVSNGASIAKVDGEEDESKKEAEDGVKSVARWRQDIKLLKEGIDEYDYFISNMEEEINTHINNVQCMLYFCCGGDVKCAIRAFKEETVKKGRKLQKKVRKMIIEIDKEINEKIDNQEIEQTAYE